MTRDEARNILEQTLGERGASADRRIDMWVKLGMLKIEERESAFNILARHVQYGDRSTHTHDLIMDLQRANYAIVDLRDVYDQVYNGLRDANIPMITAESIATALLALMRRGS